jgi:hypothetical protein
VRFCIGPLLLSFLPIPNRPYEWSCVDHILNFSFGPSKPRNDSCGVLVYVEHILDLVGLFVIVILVDTERVYPEKLMLILRLSVPKSCQRVEDVVGNGNGEAIAYNLVSGFAAAPGVGQSIVGCSDRILVMDRAGTAVLQRASFTIDYRSNAECGESRVEDVRDIKSADNGRVWCSILAVETNNSGLEGFDLLI